MNYKPKAILFDWDNTLIDTHSVINQAIQSMFIRMGKNIKDLNELDPSIFYFSAKEALPIIFKDQSDKAYEIYLEEYQKHNGKIFLINNSKNMLELLTKFDIMISLVSNKCGDLLRKEVRYFDLEKYFYKIVGSKDAKKDKPSSDVVLMALEGSDIDLDHRVWFIGDSVLDVQCALNSGCRPILFTNDSAPSFVPLKDVLIINNHQELINIITNLFD